LGNTSAAGGYLIPAPSAPFGSLTFKQFLQTVFVGISGLPFNLVRPKWEINPAKQPDVTVNWLAIGLHVNKPDANAFLGVNSDGSNNTQRHEELEIDCSFYGPDADDVASLTRDGFQVPSNLEALRSVNMGFAGTNSALRVPDLVNERWVDRYEMTVVLRREIFRTYPLLTFLSANGTIHAELSGGEKSIPFASGG